MERVRIMWQFFMERVRIIGRDKRDRKESGLE